MPVPSTSLREPATSPALRRSWAVLLAAWALLAPAWALPAPAAPGDAPAPEVRLLTPGAEREREIAAGESHRYRIELAAGRCLRVAVEQKGVDAVVAVTGPDDQPLVTVDNPSERYGPETLVVEAATAGSYQVEVRGRSRGRYGIAAEELPAATEDQRRRLAAERAMTAGAALHHEDTRESLRQAIAEYHEALAYWQAVERHREQAWTLYNLAALHGKVGEFDHALELLERTMPLWSAAGDPFGEADTYHKIGYLLARQYEYPPAIEAYRQALARREQLEDRCGQAQTLNNVGWIEHQRGAPREALAFYEQALARCGDGSTPDLEASLRNNVGGVYNVLGELEQALRHYALALPLLRAADLQRTEAVTLNNMGAAYRTLGEYEKAFEHYQLALEIRRQIGDRRGEATTLNSIGVGYLSLGEPRTALVYFRQALPLRRAAGDRRGEAATLNNLGLAYSRVGDRPRALDFHQQALEIRRTIGDRRGEAVTLDQMASLHLEMGALATAREAFEQALALLQAVGDPRREARTLGHLAEVFIALDQPHQAREHLRQAVELHRRVQDRVGEARSLPALARAERSLGEPDAAQSALESALGLIESLRIKISSPDLRASFLAAQRDAYEAAIDLVMERHRRDPAAGHDRTALAISERARARSLLELLNEAGAEIRRGVDPELVARQQSLQRRLSAKAVRQRQLLSRPASAEPAAAMERELQGILAEIRRVEAEIRHRSPGYAALTQPQPLDADRIRSLLDARTTLLHYSLGEERSFLWAVTTRSVASFELPPRPQIDNAARRLYEQWSTLDVRGQRAEAAAAAELSEQLLAPVAPRLEDGRRLVIVADGALHYLPFAALPRPATAGYEPLIVRHEIVHLPSASVLALQRRSHAGRTPPPGTVAVLADPIFERHDPRITAVVVTGDAGSSRPVRAAAILTELGRLPATRLEAEAIASLVPEDKILTRFDSQASRALVTGGQLAEYRILHFATHGLLDSQHPRLSGLVFSQFDKAGRPLDGFLPLHEIFNLRLAAELVVLSGCQTALGKEIRGEGLIGLTRGFMYAGAERVVASLWRVQDRATAELMTRFYRSLLVAEMPPAAALRKAQLELWRETGWKDPYYWAGFVLQGDWE